MTTEKDEIIYSRRQPAWHMAALSVFTLCTYNFYWFFKNLQALQDEKVSTIDDRFCIKHPLFSTFLFFIPLANLIIGLQFFALVGEIGPAAESFWHKNNQFCGFLLALAFGALLLLGIFLPPPYFLFYLISCLPLALVQHGLNQYWERQEKINFLRTSGAEAKEPLVRAAFNPIEIVIIFIGAAFLGLCAISTSVLPASYFAH